MIVTCERCATQFQLDDKRVPADGVRVRCSRCKHAFQIFRPDLSEAQRIQRVAKRALEESQAELGEPPAQAEGDTFDPVEEEESDWTFNDDRDIPDEAPALDQAAEPRDVVDDLLAGEAAASADERLDPEASAMLATDGAIDFSAPEAEGPAPAGVGTGMSEAEAADSGEVAAHRPTVHEELEAVIAEEGPLDEDPTGDPLDEPSAPDELGSPDEWDFFAEEGDPATGADTFSDEGANADFGNRSMVVHPDLVDDDAPRTGRWRARIGEAVGWTAVSLLFVLGLHAGLKPHPLDVVTLTATSVADARLEGVSGRWIDNRVAGPIYVVSGVVRGGASPLAVELVDAEGRRLETPAIPLGSPLGVSRLREEDPAVLHSLHAEEQRVRRRAPRGPFTALVGRLPARSTTYRFVSATPDPREPAADAAEAGARSAAAEAPSHPSIAVEAVNDAPRRARPDRSADLSGVSALRAVPAAPANQGP